MSKKNFNQIKNLEDLKKYFNDAQPLDEKSFVELVERVKNLGLKLGFYEFNKLFKLAPKSEKVIIVFWKEVNERLKNDIDFSTFVGY